MAMFLISAEIIINRLMMERIVDLRLTLRNVSL